MTRAEAFRRFTTHLHGCALCKRVAKERPQVNGPWVVCEEGARLYRALKGRRRRHKMIAVVRD